MDNIHPLNHMGCKHVTIDTGIWWCWQMSISHLSVRLLHTKCMFDDVTVYRTGWLGTKNGRMNHLRIKIIQGLRGRKNVLYSDSWGYERKERSRETGKILMVMRNTEATGKSQILAWNNFNSQSNMFASPNTILECNHWLCWSNYCTSNGGIVEWNLRINWNKKVHCCNLVIEGKIEQIKM